MAQRRMFSLSVVDTDRFLEMPASAQSLYFHLGMRADDEGFVSSPKKITATAGCAADDLKLLAAKGFIIPFESGVCVITDWRQNNYIQSDRFKSTLYAEEKALLSLDKNGSYTTCIQDGYSLDTQVRLGKDRLGKESIDESTGDASAPPPTLDSKQTKKKYGQYGWVKLTDEEYHRLSNDLGEAEVKRCIAYIDESAQSTGNKNKWRDWNLVVRKCNRDKWGGFSGYAPPSDKPRPQRRGVKIVNGEEVVIYDG